MWPLMIINKNMDSYNVYLFVIPGNGQWLEQSQARRFFGFNPALGGGGIFGFPDTVQ